VQSINKKLCILLISCTLAAIVLVTMFVNITVTNKFNQYMFDIQNKRYQTITSFFETEYKKEGKWTKNSGIELMHEAYMGNYCLTLKDQNKNLVWGMNPNSIKQQLKKGMPVQQNGVYTTKTFKLRVDERIVGYVEIGQYSSVLMTEEDQNFKGSINKSIVFSGIVTLFIISLLSFYFSRQISNPIKEVANLSVSLSNGNFEFKSGVKSNIKELENLRNSVNTLAEKLKKQDMLRRRLISDISHEIRTPLNVLQNNLEAMIDGVYPVTTNKLNHLNEEVIRFGKLINNLNALKEFDAERTKVKFDSINLNELISDICKDFSFAAENKNIKMDCYIEPNKSYLITADKDKLKQVFINLFSNALKFTESPGRILIRLFENKQNIVVEVSDTGIGIKGEDLPYIFERLYRGDKSRHQIEGKGIGLTIVKDILKLHNAKIDVESREGKGTKFTIFFGKNETREMIN